MNVSSFKHLTPGRRYVVVQAFADYDFGQHPVGEVWIFQGHSFLPYDSGLSLFAEIDGRERHIRMRWEDEDQGPIVDALHLYLAEQPASAAA